MREKKPVSEATRAMLEAMREDAERPPEQDKLDNIRELVAKLRDAELEKAQLSERLKEVNITINDYLWSKIPQAMDEGRVPSITIGKEGNKPDFTVAIRDHYKANIPDDRAEEAFGYLRKIKQGDLIKTKFEISFGLGESKAAERFERSLEKAGIAYSTKSGVPWNTLTAWFREEYKKKPIGPKVMEILGATVGRVAEVVKQKEKK